MYKFIIILKSIIGVLRYNFCCNVMLWGIELSVEFFDFPNSNGGGNVIELKKALAKIDCQDNVDNIEWHLSVKADSAVDLGGINNNT